MRSRYFIFLPLDVSTIESHYKECSKREYRHTSNVCTDASATNAFATNAMDDYNGPHPSSGEEECDCDCDSSLQTPPSTPPVPDTRTSSDSQPQQNLRGPQTYRRIQSLALSSVGNPPTTMGSRC